MNNENLKIERKYVERVTISFHYEDKQLAMDYCKSNGLKIVDTHSIKDDDFFYTGQSIIVAEREIEKTPQ